MNQLNASTNQIKETRVKNFASSAVANSAALIEAKRAEIRAKENELTSLLDIAPSTTMDLATRLASVDTRSMMEKVHQIQVELHFLKVTLDVMINTHNDLFPEFPESADKYANASVPSADSVQH